MPTVLHVGGFRVVIFLPPREHGPPHVHVRNAGGEVVIELAAGGRPQRIRSTSGMRVADIAKAFWLVEDNAAYLLARWEEYHD